MDQLLEAGQVAVDGYRISVWKNPAAWLLGKRLSRSFWVFFAAAFCFDIGFSVYFFLFTLYLLDFHFNERIIGLVGGALTLGTVVGTLPIGWFARRAGLRLPLMSCLIAAPLICAMRTLAMWQSAQIGLAFLAGLAMCIWGVCFPPMVARLTTTENRASAFSLIFSASIGTSALGGLIAGYLPIWLKMAGYAMQPSDVKRIILLIACAIALMGLIPMLRLQMPLQENEIPVSGIGANSWWTLSPFLWRFLPSMALWTAVMASVAAFANVYLSRGLQIPFSRIGVIFSLARVLQLCVGLLTPLVFRMLGLLNGIVATQMAAALALACLAGTSSQMLAVTFYLTFSAMQWMSSPGLYNLLMSNVPDRERSSASAMTMFCNSLVQSGAIAGVGILFVRFGYPPVFAGLAGLALIAALFFMSFDKQPGRSAIAVL